MDTKTGEFRHFKMSHSNKNSLLVNDLHKIILEPDSGIWIAYQLEKLVVSYYSFTQNTFTHYYFDTGNDKYFIFDICKDPNDNVWITSHNKLYRMDAK